MGLEKCELLPMLLVNPEDTDSGKDLKRAQK